MEEETIDEKRKQVMTYFQILHAQLKEAIEQTKANIKRNENDFDHITACLNQFREQSGFIMAEASNKAFGKQIKLEDNLGEWQKTYKPDVEVYSVIQGLMQMMAEWKGDLKGYIAKSPLIANSAV